MRHLLIALIGLFLVCCSPNRNSSAKPETPKIIHDTVTIVDTMFYEDKAAIEYLQNQLIEAQDSMIFYRDSIQFIDFQNARRIEKIKYYINITEKNANNKKFFYGWIKRTMSE